MEVQVQRCGGKSMKVELVSLELGGVRDMETGNIEQTNCSRCLGEMRLWLKILLNSVNYLFKEPGPHSSEWSSSQFPKTELAFPRSLFTLPASFTNKWQNTFLYFHFDSFCVVVPVQHILHSKVPLLHFLLGWEQWSEVPAPFKVHCQLLCLSDVEMQVALLTPPNKILQQTSLLLLFQ